MTSSTPRYKAIEDFLLERIGNGDYPVSYTHLTLPTNREAEISVVAR